MSMSFLRADGSLAVRTANRWSAWLPSRRQVQAALQLDLAGDAAALSMRQGMGLVVLAALVAGLLPFLLVWGMATRAGVIAPLAEWARGAGEAAAPGPWAELWRTARTIAVLPPSVLPGWLVAFLSALGGWINWPLRWLAWWIVYGAGVLVCAKGFGAGATLQQLFRSTSYAAVPLVLLGLGPIPCLGAVAIVVGVVWMALMYVGWVRAVTKLAWGPALTATLLPGALVALLSLLALLSLAATLARLILS